MKLDDDKETKIPKIRRELYNEEDFLKFKKLHCPDHAFTSQIAQPTEEELERNILEKKKKHLMKIFHLEDIDAQMKQSSDTNIDLNNKQ
jgi:hypothetical protein